MDFESKLIDTTNAQSETYEFRWKFTYHDLDSDFLALQSKEVVSSLNGGARFTILLRKSRNITNSVNLFQFYEISVGLRKHDGNGVTALLLLDVRNKAEHLYSKKSLKKFFSQKNEEYFGVSFTLPLSPNEIKGVNRNIHFKANKVLIEGNLFLQCEQKIEISSEGKIEVPYPMSENFYKLQRDMKELLQKGILSDVEFHIGDSLLPAHKNVLSSRSSVFRKMFEQSMNEKMSNSVKITDIEKPVFDAFLTFLYTGNIQVSDLDIVMPLYSVADKYAVDTLLKTCSSILVSNISDTTVTQILKLADMHNDIPLKTIAVDFICKNFADVAKTESWDTLLNSDTRLASYVLTEVSSTAAKKR